MGRKLTQTTAINPIARRRGMSRIAFARKYGFDYQRLQTVENGLTRLSLEWAARMAEIFQITIDTLWEELKEWKQQIAAER